jgi:DNA-binding GntR family transcriptional regulator
VSKYLEIINDIKNDVRMGTLQPGDQLPSLRQLKTHYKCSASAVTHAMIVLTTEGWVRGHAGDARYITEQPPA